jgi:hypothetical protein
MVVSEEGLDAHKLRTQIQARRVRATEI